MRVFSSLASLALLIAATQASVYVTNPVQSTSCTAGQPCEVDWVDDGQSPLLSAIGQCSVAVYTGDFILAQSLPSVDVSTTSSLTFTPDGTVGPNGQYYIVFTASSINYQGFSGSFTLSGMSGTTPTGGSSTPATSPTDTPTVSAPLGTSTPVVSITTPTGSTPVVGTTTPIGTPSTSPTLTTPTLSTPSTSPTTRATTTTNASTTSTPSSTVSATPSSAAGRVGSSVSLGGIAALFVLGGALAF